MSRFVLRSKMLANSHGLWRDCNTNDVVIARVFSRIFPENSDLESEIQRIHSFPVTTYFWSWRELDGRNRLVYCFESPVRSTDFFGDMPGSGLFRAGPQITLPSNVLTLKRVSFPKW